MSLGRRRHLDDAEIDEPDASMAVSHPQEIPMHSRFTERTHTRKRAEDLDADSWRGTDPNPKGLGTPSGEAVVFVVSGSTEIDAIRARGDDDRVAVALVRGLAVF